MHEFKTQLVQRNNFTALNGL